MRHPINVDDLPEMHRRVVTPVVQAVLPVGELEQCAVTSDAPAGHWPFPPEPGSVWLHLSARGEVFQHQLVPSTAERTPDPGPDDDQGGSSPEPGNPSVRDAQDLADDLYGRLWDWLVETGSSWGERRYGDYEVPPPSGGSALPGG